MGDKLKGRYVVEHKLGHEGYVTEVRGFFFLCISHWLFNKE